MRASGTDCKKLVAASGDENLFAKCVSQEHFPIAHLVGLTALFEIGALDFSRRFSHGNFLRPVTLESRRRDAARVLASRDGQNSLTGTFLTGSAAVLFVPESKSTRMSGSFGNTTGPSHRRKPAGAGFVSQIFVSDTLTNNFAIAGTSG